MPSTRRGFLASMAAAGAAIPLAAQLPATSRTRRPMKILVLGGTAFLGPHFVRAALANGHEVTLFNRGKATRIDSRTLSGCAGTATSTSSRR